MASNILKLGFLPVRQTAFFLCDMQEKFRPLIAHFEEICQSASRLFMTDVYTELYYEIDFFRKDFFYLQYHPQLEAPEADLVQVTNKKEAIKKINKKTTQADTLEQCQAKLSEVLQIPLIVTEQYPSGLGHTVPDIKKDHAVGVFAKTKFSMCIPEVIKEMEKINDLKCAVLFGIETHACIEQTAMDLKERGLSVHVVADSCSSRSMEDRLLALQRMKQIGCFVTTTENVIFKLLLDKNNPKFNDVRPLFKDVTPYTGLCGFLSHNSRL